MKGVVGFFIVVLVKCCFGLSPGLDYVNPFIGTGGDGFGIGENPPGAQRPFGFARVGPDSVTYNDIPIPGAWRHNGGYYYGDDSIKCFSHTHMVGAGAADYGTIAVMPFSRVPTNTDVFNYGFRSGFRHETESTLPGYYAVTLDTPQVDVEVTSTLFTGVHRYTWNNQTSTQVILFPISHSIFAKYPDGCKGANISIDATNGVVSGWMVTFGSMSGRFNGYNSYFYAKFNATIKDFGVWNGSVVFPGLKSTIDPGNIVNPNGIGGYVVLEGSNTIEMYVGISSISIDQAKTNLEAEVQGRGFDAIYNESLNSWDALFSRVQIQGGNDVDLMKFWTAFYHTLNAPSIFSETGGYYKGFDDKIHQIPSDMKYYYTDMSIWDVHRSEFPWLTIFTPDVMSDIVKSLLLMYQQGGTLPRWPFANGYTSSMVGVHGVIVIVDAYLKGIPFDVTTAYAAIKADLTIQQPFASFPVAAWYKYGFIPYDIDTTGASWTLDLSYDSWAASTLAKALGNEADYNLFFNASHSWKQIFHPEYKFFCPKTTTGEWQCPDLWIDVFDPRYVEGDAWHYRFFVPGDVAGLVEAMGKDYFAQQLEELMYNSEWDPSNYLPNPYYWAGNEPDILSVYEFNYAGRADLTQKYCRWQMDNEFTIYPNGLP